MIDIKLDSSVRTLNFGSEQATKSFCQKLEECGINTVEELCRLSKTQFCKVFRIDPDEVNMHLAKVGLKFGMTDADFVNFINQRESLIKYEASISKKHAEAQKPKFPEIVLENPLTMDTVTLKSEDELCEFYSEVTSELLDRYTKETERANANEQTIVFLKEELAKAEKLVKDLSKIREIGFAEQVESGNVNWEERLFDVTKEEYLSKTCCFLPEKYRIRKATLHALLFIGCSREFQQFLINDYRNSLIKQYLKQNVEFPKTETITEK